MSRKSFSLYSSVKNFSFWCQPETQDQKEAKTQTHDKQHGKSLKNDPSVYDFSHFFFKFFQKLRPSPRQVFAKLHDVWNHFSLHSNAIKYFTMFELLQFLFWQMSKYSDSHWLKTLTHFFKPFRTYTRPPLKCIHTILHALSLLQKEPMLLFFHTPISISFLKSVYLQVRWKSFRVSSNWKDVMVINCKRNCKILFIARWDKNKKE